MWAKALVVLAREVVSASALGAALASVVGMALASGNSSS